MKGESPRNGKHLLSQEFDRLSPITHSAPEGTVKGPKSAGAATVGFLM
jgi:hypothetical protein